MEPLLFVRADEFETFGIAPGAVSATEVVVWEALKGEPRPSLDGFAGVVVFGSSWNVEHAEEQPWIHDAVGLTREAHEEGVPLLGICFGAQLLAHALGAQVVKAPEREVGFEPLVPLAAAADDPLVNHYDRGDHVFQWHMDTFTLPNDATLLIEGERGLHQAYRVGRTTWGIQFHFEIDRPEMELWIDDVADTVERDWGKSREAILAESERFQAAHEAKGAEVFKRFVEVCASG